MSTTFVNIQTPESGLVKDGLIYWINPSNPASYPGTGTTIYDIANGVGGTTLESGATHSYSNGGIISTNGTSSYVRLKENFFDHTSGPFTVSIWFKTTNGTGTLFGQQLSSIIGDGTGWVPAIYINSGGFLVTSCFWGGSGNNISTSARVNDGKWHNVVVTFDSGSHRTYLDGSLKAVLTKTQVGYGNYYHYFLGGGKNITWPNTPSTHWLETDLGDFHFYNRALNEKEVFQNYQTMRTRYGLLYYDIVTDGLIFNLDTEYSESYPGTGSIITDSVGGLTFDFSAADQTTPFNNNNPPAYGWYFSNDYNIEASRNSTDFEFQSDNAFSVEAAVYLNENTSSGYIVSNRRQDANGTSYSGWGLLQENGTLIGLVGGYPSSSYDWRWIKTSAADYAAHVYQKWAHIVWVNDGTDGGQKLYINGIDRTTSAYDDASPPYVVNYDSSYRIGFGDDTAATTHPISANIPMCRIYNKALSESEVNRNFEVIRNRYNIDWRLRIHDSFSGSGDLYGRTPDLVNNGYTWETAATGDYEVGSGYAEIASGLTSKYALINVGFAKARIEMESRGDWVYTSQNYYQGVYWYNDTTSGTIGLLLLRRDDLVKIENGVTTVLATYGLGPRNTPLYWDVEISSSSISYELTYSGGTVYSGSFSPSVLPSASVPMGFYTNLSHPPSGGRTYISDFKVYA